MPAEEPAALPEQLDEPVVWLSLAQASTVAAHPGLAALGLALPCWAPQRLVGRALGHGPGGVDAAVAHLGRSYAWATEFENVHSFWRYDEPPLTIGGRVYAGSEAYYHAQKPKPFDKTIWDRRKRSVMELAVRTKLEADPNLRALLLATGRHPLLSLKRDAVWGFDPVTKRGENLLAEIWMQLRAEIQLKLDAPAAALAGLNNALVIGISGCTRSGKSTLASALAEALGASKTAVIRQDRFASKVLAAQAEGGWESTDSIDFKAFRDAVVEASKGSKRFVIVEGFRAFASRPPGGVVDLLHHLVWIELSREACYERRMATARVTEECFDRHLWPRHYEYWESCFGEGPMASGRIKLVLDGTKPPTLLLKQVLVALGLPAPAPAPPPPARPVKDAAAAWFDGSLKKLHEALADVEPGTNVGVVTLLGSLCPVTRGHVQAFIEARRILLGEAGVTRPARLEPFGAVLGLISLNGSSYVDRKLAQKGEASLSAEKRLALVKMAAEELPWLSWESCREGETVGLLRQTHPHLHFVHFFMNGADDVVRYRKYRVGPQHRMIVLGRPGYTAKALAGARQAGIDPDAGNFVMGPELPDISSSAAREALARGDRARAAALLHPAVLEWCEEHGPWRAATAS